MFRRVRSKIVISYCILMVAGGALSTTLVGHNMTRTLGATVDRDGLALAKVIADGLIEPLAYADRFAVRRFLNGAGESHPDLVYAFVTDPSGVIRNHTFPPGGFPSDLLQVAQAVHPVTLRTENGAVRDLGFPISEGILGTLHLGMSMAWVRAAIADAVRNVLITTGLAMVVGILGIFFLANIITRPLSDLREAAVKLGTGDLAYEAPVGGSREIADLGHAFNDMAGQIRGRVAESDELRAYMERVLDQMESSILVVSESGQVEYANRVASGRHGSLCGFSCREVMNQDRPCGECPAPEVSSTGRVVHRRYHAPSGSVYDLRWMPILGRDGKRAVLERALDITERLAVEERLQRAQRLAVAGEVAAGVVHSINNPLDGVIRAVDLATDHADDPDRVGRMLGLAREGMDRIANITRSLLGFARGDAVPRPTLVRVDALIEAAVSLSRLRAESEEVEIRFRVEGDRPEVRVDPQGMEEVLVNLLLNAVDACEEGGTVWVQAQVDSDALEVIVRDSGPGVSPEDEERVFEPFFTTKKTEKGTGLGLPVARRIVEAHGGELFLDSSAGGGATFVVRVPLRPKEWRAEREVGIA